MASSRAIRIATDEILSDPEFDHSLAASRTRLEKALAIGSEVALRRAENGLANADDAEILSKMAGMYRTLANTLPQKSLDEMSDEELTAAAGK